MRVGLVLGAGGMPAANFHAGALTALELDLGWDARTADVIVGTSAGALTGMMLRWGAAASDLAAFLSELPEHNRHRASRHLRPLSVPRPTWTDFVPRPRIDTWRNHHWRPRSALLSMLGHGRVDFRPHLSFVDADSNGAWPEGDLRICSVRREDMSRTVWSSDDGIHLTDAVASSCSVPGYATDVEIKGSMYIDGGLHSPTNADVLVGRELDLVIVLSAMTPERVGRRFYMSPVSRWAEHRLTGEVKALQEHGSEVFVLRSPPRLARTATHPITALHGRQPRELTESFLSVALRTPELGALLSQG